MDLYSRFHYVEFDTTGALVMRIDNLGLEVKQREQEHYHNLQMYSYSFEDPSRGHLLIWNDGAANRDSAGVYIVGTFNDTTDFLDSVPTLWLPQLPKAGKTWPIDANATMELA